jgi:dUTPase
MESQAIPTGVYGLLTIGLILSRSSMTLKGLQIHPGVVDQDYRGELKILAQASQNSVAIAPMEKITHLVIFPNVKVGKVLMAIPWGEKGLDSLTILTGYNRSLLTALRWLYF